MNNLTSAAARVMRSIPSEKRAQASRENGKRGGIRLTAECTCHTKPHAKDCPRYLEWRDRVLGIPPSE